MSSESIGLPDDFQNLVRDALIHLHDTAHLQTHPLLRVMSSAESTATARGKLLFRELLQAIEALRPTAGTEPSSRSWRAYRILELRYVDGLDVGEVADEIALSKNQYHRDNSRAIEAVSSILWDRWRMAERCGDKWVASSSDRLSDQGLARLEANQLSAEEDGGRPGQIDPVEVIRGVADLLQPLCAQRGVDLRIDVPERLPAVLGERVTLRQALIAVVARAIGMTGCGTIGLKADYRANRVEVFVSSPIDGAPDLDSLSIDDSRSFVEALKGYIIFGPQPGQPDRWETRLSVPACGNPRLLVIDNNADFVRLIERYLAGDVWEVVGASDFEQARALARQGQFSLILLDIVIPGRDGWDLLLDFRADRTTQRVPVIICSVLHEPDVALSLGAVAYLQKPVDKQQLLETLSRYCPSPAAS